MHIVIGLIEHFGDIVACEPVARHLKASVPGCILSWVVRAPFRDLIDANPAVDQTIVVECLTEWIIIAKHKRHGKESFDRVVDLHVNYRACSHCGVPLIKTTGNPFINANEWLDHGALLEAFSVGAGLPRLSDAPRVYIQDRHRAKVDSLPLPEKFCVVHRRSNDVEKDWRDTNWTLLVRSLRETFGMHVVELGQTSDTLPRAIPGTMNLLNKTSILESAEVVRRAQFFVGVDSSVAHLANAVGTPGVVLLGKYKIFRSYNPFTGLYSGKNGSARVVRNLTGPVAEIPLNEVVEAISYVQAFSAGASKPVVEVLDWPETTDIVAEATPTTEPEPSHHFSLNTEDSLPRVLAFYLPQFHPIPENNAAYGMGFTEWFNVIKSLPLFKGHYQPRLPGELGYYDLRSLEVLEAQVQLALDHGITGFCFYYYYFEGKRLLQTPVRNFIDSGIDMPFCFLWANENWSRRWDGGDLDVIIQQRHSPEDDMIFFQTILPDLRNPRYIKIAGKPLLIIYKPHLFPDIRASTERWRSAADEAGLPGVYLVMADDWSLHDYHPRELGFDASYEIPTNIVTQDVATSDLSAFDLEPGFEGQLIDYAKFAKFHSHRSFPVYKRFKTVMAPWDNSPRYRHRALVHVNTENDSYRQWLTTAYLDTFKRYAGDERLLFVHSWNEWCEGTYIEPDGRHGRRYLEETLGAVADARHVIQAAEAAGVDLNTASILNRIGREREEVTSLYWRLWLRDFSTLQLIRGSRAWRLIRPLQVVRATLRKPVFLARRVIRTLKRLG